MKDVALQLDSIVFKYGGGDEILSGMSFSAQYGEMVAITGPSGRGKSTLLYLAGLMLRPDRGEVRYAGQRVDSLPDNVRAALRANRFGFIFQDALLDPGRTVLDNVMETALYRGETRRMALLRARELLDQFGVGARAERKPGQISGGQAQRIALCRALLGRPQLILADEPTGNLDPASSLVVMNALSERADAGSTILVVTHDDQVARRCDRSIPL